MIESGVIKPDGKGSKAALVYGQMNEPPGARARVGLKGLTVAEYLEIKKGKMFYFLLIIYLDLLRLDQKYLLF